MEIKDLTNNELYSLLKMGDLLTAKYFRESNINKKSEMEYITISNIMNNLYQEANKRLTNLT